MNRDQSNMGDEGASENEEDRTSEDGEEKSKEESQDINHERHLT